MPAPVEYQDTNGDSVRYSPWGPLSYDRAKITPAIDEDLVLAFSGTMSETVLESHLKRWKPYADKINSLGFRSDELTNDHNEKYHIIFLGDSNTFGEGLEKEEMWSKIVYNHINSITPCSGYFNLGLPGRSNLDMISNIYKYIKSYGKPDVIFLHLTELSRFYGFDPIRKTACTVKYDKGNYEVIRLVMYDYYMMLEKYCKDNGILLISFTWDIEKSDNFDSGFETVQQFFKNMNFETFVSIKSEDMQKWLYLNNDNTDYFVIARDGSHYGLGYNLYWSKVAIQEWEKNREDSRYK